MVLIVITEWPDDSPQHRGAGFPASDFPIVTSAFVPRVDTQAVWKERGIEGRDVQVVGIRLHVFDGCPTDSQSL